MVRMRADIRSHRLMTLETRFVRLHLLLQLSAACPLCKAGPLWIIRMHLMARNARKLAAAKTRGCLYTIKFAARDADHPVTPKPIGEIVRLAFANKFFLLEVIG